VLLLPFNPISDFQYFSISASKIDTRREREEKRKEEILFTKDEVHNAIHKGTEEGENVVSHSGQTKLQTEHDNKRPGHGRQKNPYKYKDKMRVLVIVIAIPSTKGMGNCIIE
jgi:hypothetical protein